MNGNFRAFRVRVAQSGVALITVLLVIFLASITAVSLASLQQLSIRRSTVLQHQQQARLYVLGAEQWAIQILARDRAESDIDHLNEDWAQLPPALPVPGGQISGRIEDLQARFNLNNLEQKDALENHSESQFKRLLSTLNLPQSLVGIVSDWIDSDQTLSFPDGAEDSDYLNYNPAYLAANQYLRSISEVRLLKGVDAEVYQQLSPYISVLPESAPINVNTAPAPVLTTLHDDLDLDKAEQLVQDRADQEFTDDPSFTEALTKLGIDIDADHPVAQFTTASDYFAVHAEARVGDARALLYSVLQRTDDGRSNVIFRSFTRED